MSEAMNAEDDGSVTGFMCLVDWELEMGANFHGNAIYPSVEALMENRPCSKSCGIVQVSTRYVRTILEEAECTDNPTPQKEPQQ